MDTIQHKTQKSTIKKSTKDTEIESLDEKRKELIQKAKKKKKKKKKTTKRQDRIRRTQQISEKDT